MSIRDKINEIEAENKPALHDWQISALKRKAEGLQRAMENIGIFAEILEDKSFDLRKIKCHTFETADPTYQDSIEVHFYPYIGGTSVDVHIHYDDVDRLCKELQETLKVCREYDEKHANKHGGRDVGL